MNSNNQIERLKIMLDSNMQKEEILEKFSKDITQLQSDLPCGINFIITNDNGELLLLKRKSSIGSGTWSLCGGHLGKDETIEQTAVRECMEELGIEVEITDVKVVSLADTMQNKRYLQIGVVIEKYLGTPKIMEPQKASDLIWVTKETVPENLFFGTKANIELYFENKFYDRNKNI